MLKGICINHLFLLFFCCLMSLDLVLNEIVNVSFSLTGLPAGHLTWRGRRWKCDARPQPSSASGIFSRCESSESRQRNNHRFRRWHSEIGDAVIVDTRRNRLTIAGRGIGNVAWRSVLWTGSEKIDRRLSRHLARHIVAAALFRWIRSTQNHSRMQTGAGLLGRVRSHWHDGRFGPIPQGSESVSKQSVAWGWRPWERADASSA